MKERLVVYTAIIGSYDELEEPQYITPNCDYICFTDQDLKSDVWQIRKVLPLYEDNTRTARKYKTLPHRFLSEYDVSIWVDGNMIIRGDAWDYVNKHLGENNGFAVSSHMDCFDKRNCIYEEANAIFYFGQQNGKYKDDPNVIQKQMERYMKMGYPRNNTLASTGIILRRHNWELMKVVGETWWQEIKYGSKRDQLSLNYALWITNNAPFVYTGDDVRDNEFVKHVTHKK